MIKDRLSQLLSKKIEIRQRPAQAAPIKLNSKRLHKDVKFKLFEHSNKPEEPEPVVDKAISVDSSIEDNQQHNQAVDKISISSEEEQPSQLMNEINKFKQMPKLYKKNPKVLKLFNDTVLDLSALDRTKKKSNIIEKVFTDELATFMSKVHNITAEI